MKSTAPILALAVAAAAAPIDKRQSGFDLGSLTGGMGSSAGSFGDLGSLSSLGSTGSSLGSLGSLPGSTTTGSSTDSPLGSLGSFPSSGSSLGSFGSLPSTGSSLGSLGSLPSTGSSLGSIGSLPSTGSAGSLGSLGSLEGASTGSSLGSLGSFPASSADSPSPTNSSSAGLESSEPESTTATPSAGLSAPSGNCKAVTLLFARGTGEPGTMGYIVGPPLAKALAASLGDDKVTSEGVDYPASAAGNADLGASGGQKMAAQANSILSSCPDTKLVLGGYSQGGMVVHNALSAQGLDGSKVAAVVAFGDPFNGQAFKGVDASKVKEFCGKADSLCAAGGANGSGSSHLDYGSDAEAAAQFIVGVVGK